MTLFRDFVIKFWPSLEIYMKASVIYSESIKILR